MLAFTPWTCESGRPGSNGRPRSGAPVLCRLSYVRETPGRSRTGDLCRRRAALCPLSYGRVKEPPAGIEPAPRPYKGRVLAVDTTEARGGDGRSRTDIALVASEVLSVELRPQRRCGRVESNHHSSGPRGYSPLSSPMLSVRKRPAPRSGFGFRKNQGDRPGSNRHCEDHDLGCCRYTTVTV
jgi:hypothetical protein